MFFHLYDLFGFGLKKAGQHSKGRIEGKIRAKSMALTKNKL
jgi:hypothetical protein